MDVRSVFLKVFTKASSPRRELVLFVRLEVLVCSSFCSRFRSTECFCSSDSSSLIGRTGKF